MNNYDHDILGVGNPMHPANQEELGPIEEKDLTIAEAYETGHDHLFQEALQRSETHKEKVISELIFYKEYAEQKHDKFLKNRIIKLLKTFD